MGFNIHWTYDALNVFGCGKYQPKWAEPKSQNAWNCKICKGNHSVRDNYGRQIPHRIFPIEWKPFEERKKRHASLMRHIQASRILIDDFVGIWYLPHWVWQFEWITSWIGEVVNAKADDTLWQHWTLQCHFHHHHKYNLTKSLHLATSFRK